MCQAALQTRRRQGRSSDGVSAVATKERQEQTKERQEQTKERQEQTKERQEQTKERQEQEQAQERAAAHQPQSPPA